MPRAARIIIPGYPHHVVQRGTDRAPVFRDVGDYLAYLKLLRRFCEQYQVEVWAWCLLPDHVHLLAVPADAEALGKAMGSASLVYTQHLNQKYRRSGRSWQNRYFSCLVDGDDYLLTAAGTIELHPVHAGKVRRPEEWPWSSARHHLLGKPDPLVTSPFPGFPGPQSWRELLAADGLPADRLRLATSTGRPFAGPQLIAALEQRLGKRLTARRRGRPRKSAAPAPGDHADPPTGP